MATRRLVAIASDRRRGRSGVSTVLPFVRQQLLPAPFQPASHAVMLSAVLWAVEPLQGYLIVQQVSDRAVEVGRVGTLEHHLQIIAVLPMSLHSELRLDQLVELRARQGIGH